MDLKKYKAELTAEIGRLTKIRDAITEALDGTTDKPKRVVSAETRAKLKAAWAKRKAAK